MKRYIYDSLLAWKAKADRKPLIIHGARQVGKTWIMKTFGKAEYENMIYANCDEEPRLASLFGEDFDISRIILELQAIYNVQVEANKTLIVFDEIQEVPRGLQALKYFHEKAPQIHVMAAGSLLGIALHEGTSFPVGKVDMLTLYPMNFMEFLQAKGEDGYVSLLKNAREQYSEAVATKLIQLLRQYYYVGGMPEVVKSFVERGNVLDVREKQLAILDAYRNDISKHAGKQEVMRISMVINSLPSQLAKENKKFVYGVMRKGARAADFEIAIQWLVDCGIVHKVSRVKKMQAPLKFYEDLSAFKLFFLDCGLLGALAEVSADQMLVGNTIFSEYKGAFTEQYVHQQLRCICPSIYYWSNEQSTAEVDFLVQNNGRVVPIEVKAENNLRSKSLRNIIEDNPELKAIRFSMSNYVNQDWMENIPLYAIPHF